jgi:hypothetical protein
MSDRHIQKAQLKIAERQRILAELNQLAVDVERCERTIGAVMAELNAVNTKYQGQRTTRQDVEYLTVLLDSAKKKLAWEKQIASLRKRAPALLENMTRTLDDKDYPPTEEMKAAMLRSLQIVQSALERLQAPDGEE